MSMRIKDHNPQYPESALTVTETETREVFEFSASDGNKSVVVDVSIADLLAALPPDVVRECLDKVRLQPA